MKKVLWLIVCLMAMVMSVNAQVNMFKIKEAALNKFKLTLIAPSQFILTDYYGNKTNINSLRVEKFSEYYEVTIIGDAMNRCGGYERVSEKIYVNKFYIAKTLEEIGRENEVRYMEKIDSMPKFPNDLNKYIKNNLKYPISAAENGIERTVVVGFVIERDGSISNVNVISSPDLGLSREAVRLVKSMPKWNPAMQNGSPVRVKYNVPVKFKL